MNFVAVLISIALTASVTSAQGTSSSTSFEQYKSDLIAQGATPEQVELFETIYSASRPTLVCLCHHEAPVTTCGVDGHRYLNLCAARCAHVEVACSGDACGDCRQYAREATIEEAESSTPTVAYDDVAAEQSHTHYDPAPLGRRFLTS